MTSCNGTREKTTAFKQWYACVWMNDAILWHELVCLIQLCIMCETMRPIATDRVDLILEDKVPLKFIVVAWRNLHPRPEILLGLELNLKLHYNSNKPAHVAKPWTWPTKPLPFTLRDEGASLQQTWVTFTGVVREGMWHWRQTRLPRCGRRS